MSIATNTCPELPLLSQQAWTRLLTDVENSKPGMPAFPSALRLAALPGFERVAGSDPERWVPQYEQILERLGRRQRKQGEPQTGVFFTPRPVARYLVSRTLGRLLERFWLEFEQAVRQKEMMTAQAILGQVQQLRVIDPACGTGVFLLEALEVFAGFYQNAQKLLPDMGVESLIGHAFGAQLAGVDIDPLSVVITEARVWHAACRWDQDLAHGEYGSKNCFYRGDTLLGSGAGSGAETETALWNGPWDFVLGNPPYVSEVRKQAARFRDLSSVQTYYRAKMDLCDAFLIWGMTHLKPGGQLAYVLPAYWTQRASTEPVRRQMLDVGNVLELWQFDGAPVFKNAPGHHSGLLIWQNEKKNETDICRTRLGHAVRIEDLHETNLQEACYFLEPKSGKLVFENELVVGLMTRLSTHPPLLGKAEIQQGIVLPQGRLKKTDRKRLSKTMQNNLSDSDGIFLLTENEVQGFQFSESEKALLKPFYGPAKFKPFSGFAKTLPEYQLIYTDFDSRKKIENEPEQYAKLRTHMDRFASVLTSDFAPYGLHRARQRKWFEAGVKVLCPRQVERPSLAVVTEETYVGEGFYILRPKADDADVVVALMNSLLGWFWFYQHKRKGHRLQIDKDVLSIFPAPLQWDDLDRTALIACVKTLKTTTGGARESAWRTLNDRVYQMYQLSGDEIAYVEKSLDQICHH